WFGEKALHGRKRAGSVHGRDVLSDDTGLRLSEVGITTGVGGRTWKADAPPDTGVAHVSGGNIHAQLFKEGWRLPAEHAKQLIHFARAKFTNRAGELFFGKARGGLQSGEVDVGVEAFANFLRDEQAGVDHGRAAVGCVRGDDAIGQSGQRGDVIER